VRAPDALSPAAPYEVVPRHIRAAKIATPPTPQTEMLIPDRRLTGGLVIRASRMAGTASFT
jgi:hypothetical protein